TQALLLLVDRHPALSSRFELTGGVWRQTILEQNDRTILISVDLSQLDKDHSEKLFERLAGDAQRSLDLANGPLTRSVLATLPGGARRLFLTIHHLVVDWVSWRILVADLDNLAKYMVQGINSATHQEGTSFKAWAETLCRYSSSSKLAGEAAYWLEIDGHQESRLAVKPEGANNVGSERWFDASLNEPLSRLLIQEAPKHYGARAQDLLIAALLLAWRELTGSNSILLDFESHGRPDSFPGVDLSGTVGWFTAIFPLALVLPEGLDSIRDNSRIVQALHQQLEAVPDRGIGFGTLKYLCPNQEIRSKLEALPKPQVSFNYLGQFDQALPQDSLFLPVGTRTGEYRNPEGLRSHVLDVQLSVIDGVVALGLIYSENLLSREIIERLAASYLNNLEDLIVNRPAHQPVQSGTRLDAIPLVDQAVLD
ncbi:MAG: condensation domain-containing protein, partial [Blastocatellia bacterium]